MAIPVILSALASANAELERDWLSDGSPDSTPTAQKPAPQAKPISEDNPLAAYPTPLPESKTPPVLLKYPEGTRLESRRPMYFMLAAVAGVAGAIAGSQASEDIERTREVEVFCFKILGYCPDPPEKRTETYTETKIHGQMVAASLVGYATSIGFLIAGFNAKVSVASPPAGAEGPAPDLPDFKVTVAKGF